MNSRGVRIRNGEAVYQNRVYRAKRDAHGVTLTRVVHQDEYGTATEIVFLPKLSPRARRVDRP